MNRVIRVFLETDMRNQHNGLLLVAKKQKVDLRIIEPGTHIVFINRAMDKIKLYSSNGVLTYYRSGRGRLNLNIIEQIPKSFDAKGKLNWDEATRLALEKQLQVAHKSIHVPKRATVRIKDSKQKNDMHSKPSTPIVA